MQIELQRRPRTPMPQLSSDMIIRYMQNGLIPSCENDIFLYYDIPLLFAWRPQGCAEGTSFLVGYTNLARFHETLLITVLSASNEGLYKTGVISYRDIIEDSGENQLFLARCGPRRCSVKAVKWQELVPDELPQKDSYL